MPRPRNTPELIWSKIDRSSIFGCWRWTGPSNKGGYGRIEIDSKPYYVHRIIYDLAHPGEITWNAPSDRFGSGFIRHTCDNPWCCNPDHLVIGTHAENMRDKVERSRQSRLVGVKSPNAKLTEEDVFSIRMNRKYGVKRRALAMLHNVSEATNQGMHYRNTL